MVLDKKRQVSSFPYPKAVFNILVIISSGASQSWWAGRPSGRRDTVTAGLAPQMSTDAISRQISVVSRLFVDSWLREDRSLLDDLPRWWFISSMSSGWSLSKHYSKPIFLPVPLSSAVFPPLNKSAVCFGCLSVPPSGSWQFGLQYLMLLERETSEVDFSWSLFA